MDYLLGVLTTALFFVALITAYLIGQRTAKKQSVPLPLDDDKRREIERFDKGFKEMFRYDVDKALQRKKVT